jgi:endonuclease/exonuclease/phosphatase family metal-dependent hydrolase
MAINHVQPSLAFTALSLNCWSGLTYDNVFKSSSMEPNDNYHTRERIINDYIISIKPDIVCLSEVRDINRYNNRFPCLKSYASHYIVTDTFLSIGKTISLPSNLTQGIFSAFSQKFTLKKKYKLKLSDTFCINKRYLQFIPFETNYALISHISLNDLHDFVIINCQLNYSDVVDDAYIERIRQSDLFTQREKHYAVKHLIDEYQKQLTSVEKLLMWIDSYKHCDADKNTHFILFADLNSTHESPIYKKLIDYGFSAGKCTNEFTKHTWTPEDNTNLTKYEIPWFNIDSKTNKILKFRLRDMCKAKTIDHVLVKSIYDNISLKYKIVDVKHKNLNIHASDHFGILSTLIIEE